MKTKWIQLLRVVIYVGLCNLLNAQTTDSLPLDPSIRYGRLPNGFTYYIKQLPASAEKVSMELTAKVGANQQDADQNELAHFLEHMPFIHTKHFTNILKDTKLLKKMQMQISDIRGRTGGDRTVYSFNYPSGNKIALKKGLLFFQDIAGGEIQFHKKEVDGERGAIYEEYLYGKGPEIYPESKIIEVFSDCSQSALDPVVFKNHIENFPIATVKRFYQDWYRPDLMAITLVGNIPNVEDVEKQIVEAFSGIPLPDTLREFKDCNKEYLSRSKQFVALEDPIKPTEGIIKPIDFKFFVRTYKEQSGGFQSVEEEVFEDMLVNLMNKRFLEVKESYNIPYKIYSYFDFNLSTLRIEVKSSKKEHRSAIQKAFSIYCGIRENGFTKEELEAYKHKKTQALMHRDNQNSVYWETEIINNFVSGKALPVNKFDMIKNWLDNLSLTEFNREVAAFLPKTPEDIAVVVPNGGNINDYSEGEIRRWIRESDPQPYRPKTAPSSLISAEKLKELPVKKAIKMGTDDLGAQKIVLDNGLTLILKPFIPTAGRYKDKVMIHGFNSQGASCFSKEDYYAATLAPDIIGNAGVGKLDKFDLKNFLENTSIPFGPRLYITANESGIKEETNKEDLETALQLIYLYFTAPRIDKNAFQDWRTIEREKFLKGSSGDMVKLDFLTKVNEILEDSTAKPRGTKRYREAQEVKQKRAYEIYKVLMQNAAHFTFIITGDYSVNKVLPMLKKYLGNLPNASKITCEKNHHNRNDKKLPKRPFKEVFQPNKKIENAHVIFKYIKELDPVATFQEEVAYKILVNILTFKIHDLRYVKKRDVYLSFVGSGVNRIDKRRFINLQVSCSKKDLNLVEEDIKEMITSLKRKGVKNELFNEVMESYIIPQYSAKKKCLNQHVQQTFYDHYRYDIPFIDKQKRDKFIKAIKRTDIPKIAKKYLKDEFLMEFVAKSELKGA